MPKNHAKDSADIIIIGGGLAGLTLCARLGNIGLSVICLDRDDPEAALKSGYDDRTIAISFGAQKIIAAAGAWNEAALPPCPINSIKIYDGNSPLLLDMFSREMHEETGASAFGWIVENRMLRQCLMERVNALPNVRHIAPARVVDFSVDDNAATALLDDGAKYSAPLIIGADGRGSFTRQWMKVPTRQWSYNQHAIVFPVTHDHPHDHVAVEHFHRDGPFAILPMHDDVQGHHRSAVVWTHHGNIDQSSLHWPEDVFNAALNARFPDFYGRVTLAGPRKAWPLGLIHAARYTGKRMALIADAAHGIHPIAGQGLNLGLRDIDYLTGLLETAKRDHQDFGAPGLLDAYERTRRLDNTVMTAFTDNLNRLFSSRVPGLSFIRRLGLRGMKDSNSAKKILMRYTMGLGTRS